MGDKTTLEACARFAHYTVIGYNSAKGIMASGPETDMRRLVASWFNPLTSDADCDMLLDEAARRGLSIALHTLGDYGWTFAINGTGHGERTSDHANDIGKARRAAVCGAVEKYQEGK